MGQNTYEIVNVDPEGTSWDGPEELERQLNDWLALPHPGSGWLEVMNFERESFVTVDVVLWDLCRRGIAPVGEYLIRVSW